MWGEGWVPTCAGRTEGEGMMMEGWVTSASSRGGRLSVGTTGGGHCGMTGDTGMDGSRTVPTGEGAVAWGRDTSTLLRCARNDVWGRGMDPRMREDNGGGGAVREPSLRGKERLHGDEIPRLHFAALGMTWGVGDGSPHARGQRMGGGAMGRGAT